MTFVWGFNTDGDEYMKQYPDKRMPDMPEYKCGAATDDNGTNIYQIYWSEDGYFMQFDIPFELFDSSEEFTKEELLELEKVSFKSKL